MMGLLCLGGPGSGMLPRERPLPAVSAAPRMHGPGGSRGALAATIDPHQPAGQGAGLATVGLAGHNGDAFLPECPPC